MCLFIVTYKYVETTRKNQEKNMKRINSITNNMKLTRVLDISVYKEFILCFQNSHCMHGLINNNPIMGMG